MPEFTNDLIKSSSPYLLQHAHNPVNWVEWSTEAFDRARAENKLVLISIGYSACHWCHVMEKESFENIEVAEIMNKYFVCIKVDREERPDVDQIYMQAVQIMTGQGGWPLNCFALNDGRPIYGGTYFPIDQWKTVLQNLQQVFSEQPEKVEDYAEKLTEGIRQSDLINKQIVAGEFDTDILDLLVKKWKTKFDFEEGGDHRAPKFPLPNNYEFLLRYGVQKKDKTVLSHVALTLEKMAFGGIYDQIGGGFSRYSVDLLWKVPHFEKMLYDNAQLLTLYGLAYQQFKNPLYENVIRETVSWLNREMKDFEGGYFSAIDADSEGVEGRYYVWTKDELRELLQEDFDWFSDYYNINQLGYWEEGNYILMRTHRLKDFADKHGLHPEEFRIKLNKVREKLLQRRALRTKPGIDDKKLTAWNAMTIKGLATAGTALQDSDLIDEAIALGNWLQNFQLEDNFSLWRTSKHKESKIKAFIEDYAHTIDAFITLYEVSFDTKWIQLAYEILGYCNTKFTDEKTGMYFFTEDSGELIARKTEIHDNVIPSSNSVMAHNLFRLGKFYADDKLIERARQMLSNLYPDMPGYGSGYSNWAMLALNFTEPFYEISVTGNHEKHVPYEMGKQYFPNKILAGGKTDHLPVLKDKNTDEKLIYVCVNRVCLAPYRTLDEALKAII
ncbi:MAG: thioredoxin domain-containing protein [Brumimicrobium sp.]|nr:thioredoxin domain-containing protein [Brumimicrobium sp.]